MRIFSKFAIPGPVRAATHALGLTQIIGWGTTMYAPAILATPIVADTGWGRTEVFAAFSASLVIGALAARPAGKLIDRHGGRAFCRRFLARGALSLAFWTLLRCRRIRILAVSLCARLPQLGSRHRPFDRRSSNRRTLLVRGRPVRRCATSAVQRFRASGPFRWLRSIRRAVPRLPLSVTDNAQRRKSPCYHLAGARNVIDRGLYQNGNDFWHHPPWKPSPKR